MIYKKIDTKDITYFQQILGNENVIIAKEYLEKYSKDETEDLQYFPDVALKPVNTSGVSKILSYCNANNICVTTRGAGTGLSGGALPIMGGVILSTERFNSIIEIDERNMQATVEPGVINYVFQEEVKKKGLFYAPDPASWGSCFLGGNVAHASGGPRAVKYGTTRDYILNLEIVLPNGEIIWTGANTLKYSTGYNLTHLMIGSEGTLAVITKIRVKLIPFNDKNVVMLVPFFSAEKACEAVSAVFRAGIIPSAMEFMERDAIDWVLKYTEGINIHIKPEVQAHLLIEIDGTNLDHIMQQAEQVVEVLQNFECDEILFADTESEKENIWKMRRKVAEAVKSNSVYKEEDTVVPRAELPLLLKGVKEIGSRYGFKSVCYGHAGDGNLHVNIIKGDTSEEVWNNDLPKGIREIFELCKKLGGTISGEHGIGLVQKPYMNVMMTESHFNLFKGIKNVFDPQGILNPGKIF